MGEVGEQGYFTQFEPLGQPQQMLDCLCVHLTSVAFSIMPATLGTKKLGLSTREGNNNNKNNNSSKKYSCRSNEGAKEGIVAMETWCHYVKGIAVSKFHVNWPKMAEIWAHIFYGLFAALFEKLYQTNGLENKEPIWMLLWGFVWRSTVAHLAKIQQVWPLKTLRVLINISLADMIGCHVPSLGSSKISPHITIKKHTPRLVSMHQWVAEI